MLLSLVLDALYDRVEAVGRHRFWFLALVLVFLIVTFINGVGLVPEEPYQRLSEYPFITRTDIHFNNYWQENLFLPVLAYFLGFTGTIRFNALVFATIFGAFSLFAWLAFLYRGSVVSMVTSTILITSPLTTVFLSWLGTPDGLTILLTIPFLFIHSGILMFSLAVLGAMNHLVFVIAAVEILILRWIARDRINLRHLVYTVVGAALGYGIVKFFLYSNKIEVMSRVDFMQLRNLSEWTNLNLETLPIALYSLFNIQWLILPVCLIMFFKKDRLFYVLVIFILLVNYGMTFFMLDTTRVFGLLSWGVLFECIFHSVDISVSQSEQPEFQKQFMQALALTGILSLFSSRYFVWVGEIHATPFFAWIEKLFQI
jgi:hypothetical protein